MPKYITDDNEIEYEVRQALAIAVRGDMRASLFMDTVSSYADTLMDHLPFVHKSKKHVVESVLTQWRIKFYYLKDLPDQIEGE